MSQSTDNLTTAVNKLGVAITAAVATLSSSDSALVDVQTARVNDMTAQLSAATTPPPTQ